MRLVLHVLLLWHYLISDVRRLLSKILDQIVSTVILFGIKSPGVGRVDLLLEGKGAQNAARIINVLLDVGLAADVATLHVHDNVCWLHNIDALRKVEHLLTRWQLLLLAMLLHQVQANRSLCDAQGSVKHLWVRLLQ